MSQCYKGIVVLSKSNKCDYPRMVASSYKEYNTIYNTI